MKRLYEEMERQIEEEKQLVIRMVRNQKTRGKERLDSLSLVSRTQEREIVSCQTFFSFSLFFSNDNRRG